MHELEKPDATARTSRFPTKLRAHLRLFRPIPVASGRTPAARRQRNQSRCPRLHLREIHQPETNGGVLHEGRHHRIHQQEHGPAVPVRCRARQVQIAFENPNGPTVWDLLRENPDRYIYDAVKKGVEIPLPTEIAVPESKTCPSATAGTNPRPSEFALPTEIWREVVARRQRYDEIRIENLPLGEVAKINDFITLNLDLRQFAQDVIQNCEGPDLLRAFWQAISTITVLDPTGGSGAFSLPRSTSLNRSTKPVSTAWKRLWPNWSATGEKHQPEKFSQEIYRSPGPRGRAPQPPLLHPQMHHPE